MQPLSPSLIFLTPHRLTACSPVLHSSPTGCSLPSLACDSLDSNAYEYVKVHKQFACLGSRPARCEPSGQLEGSRGYWNVVIV
ncbi:hypothetical protein P153DRAFT_362353 [Dothidotthia symphoricarpi CBS 119687]|uniref:Uncharacterized protein n=1 Tax=Dothidotthia symphoricarpi CBS 119687 TaxID=1392245 RepID=A0A6A6ASP8_9PLEO|nr:uncharacterized protein P153DRAFT_362353 [Dothidotthia symphoricarpi CBS 119687]KAF2134596.1 hypothetical protein P153DRAFT_362353 [Dothidotthia symphoricarpi CBS 119687]